MVGYYDDRSNARSFRPLTLEGEHGARELAVFSGRARAGAALKGLEYNADMVRLRVPVQNMGAREISLAGAMAMARAVECGHVVVDVGFEEPHRRIPTGWRAAG